MVPPSDLWLDGGGGQDRILGDGWDSRWRGEVGRVQESLQVQQLAEAPVRVRPPATVPVDRLPGPDDVGGYLGVHARLDGLVQVIGWPAKEPPHGHGVERVDVAD